MVMYKINNSPKKMYYFAPSIISLSFFWPLVTTGSFFTNWIATIFWFMFAINIGFKYRLIMEDNDK